MGSPITGNFPGTAQVTQLANLLQQDIVTYLANGIGTSFNILKSQGSRPSDYLVTFNGRV